MGKKLLTPERKAHLAKLKKASRLRAKAEKGALSDVERQELEALESVPKLKGGRPKIVKNYDGETHGAAQPSEVADDESGQVTKSEEQPKKPPPPPPVVEVIPSSKGDWRNRYRAESVGREAACVQVAILYTTLLKRMARYIEESGVTPIMGEQEIDTAVFGAAVLTADKLMPDVDFGPEVQLALGSGLVMSQAVYAAMKRKKEKGAKPIASKPAATEPAKTPPPTQEQNSNGHISVDGTRIPDGKVF